MADEEIKIKEEDLNDSDIKEEDDLAYEGLCNVFVEIKEEVTCEEIKQEYCDEDEMCFDPGNDDPLSGKKEQKDISEYGVAQDSPCPPRPRRRKPPEIHQCPDCGYRTKRKYHLKRHSLTHVEAKLYSCEQCSYRTNSSYSLKSHQLVHETHDLRDPSDIGFVVKVDTEEGGLETYSQVFKCYSCDYMTRRKDDLKRHGLVHSNIKSFKCSVCDYEGRRNQDLRMHELTHSEEKMFKCSQCQYETNRKKDLNCHELKHSGRSPFTCSQCSYTTTKKSNLKYHILVHLDTKLFKCSYCDYETNWKKDLALHTAAKHHGRTDGHGQ